VVTGLGFVTCPRFMFTIPAAEHCHCPLARNYIQWQCSAAGKVNVDLGRVAKPRSVTTIKTGRVAQPITDAF